MIPSWESSYIIYLWHTQTKTLVSHCLTCVYRFIPTCFHCHCQSPCAHHHPRSVSGAIEDMLGCTQSPCPQTHKSTCCGGLKDLSMKFALTNNALHLLMEAKHEHCGSMQGLTRWVMVHYWFAYDPLRKEDIPVLHSTPLYYYYYTSWHHSFYWHLAHVTIPVRTQQM